MSEKPINGEDLAVAILTVIGERYGRLSGKGYYGVDQGPDVDPAKILEEAQDQLLDGTDNFVAICEEALRRLRS